ARVLGRRGGDRSPPAGPVSAKRRRVIRRQGPEPPWVGDRRASIVGSAAKGSGLDVALIGPPFTACGGGSGRSPPPTAPTSPTIRPPGFRRSAPHSPLRRAPRP